MDKIVGLHNAGEIANVSYVTMREWCLTYPGLGEKVGSQWHIDPIKLATVIQARQHLKLLKAG